MAHRKAEYNACGHEVTIQQVNKGGDISAWIDGWAGHVHQAIDYITNPTTEGSLTISEKIDSLRESGEMWKAIETMCAFMVDNDVYFCKQCDTFYDCDDVSGTGMAGHICGDCAREAATCPENPDGDDHDDECLNPRQRHNARVSTRYKCVHCDRVRRTTPTG